MKKRWFRTAILLISIFPFLNSCSDDPLSPEETGIISGTVINSQTSEPVTSVSITTSPPTTVLLTDSTGAFRIADVTVGNYSITASKDGYNKTSVSFRVRNEAETVVAIQMDPLQVENTAPGEPFAPAPSDEATGQDISVQLQWSCTNLDAGDTLLYTVRLFEADSATRVIASDISDTTIALTTLHFGRHYFWQVIATDTQGESTNGPVWSFRTMNFPELPVVHAVTNGQGYDVFTANPDTLDAGLYPLTSNPAVDWYPRRSPDGQQIAFISNREIDFHLYLMDSDGSNVRKITTLPVAGFHSNGRGFSWSPEGSRLLYAHYDQLYLIHADRSGLTPVAIAPADRNFSECDWSSLGNRIVALTVGSWQYDSEIYLMDSDGSNPQDLMGNLPGALGSPAFSPDGNRVLFTHDVSGYEGQNGRRLDNRVFILDLVNGDTTDVSTGKTNGTNDAYPRWSPDGAHIIFANYPNYDESMSSVWVMNADGTNRKKIVSRGTMPDWR